jgi:hypothetical protein
MKTGKCTKRARKHLKDCAKHNRPEYLLWLLALTPYVMRRASFKVGSLLELIN